GGREIQVGSDGGFTIPGVRIGSRVEVEAKGHQPTSSLVALGDQLRLALAPRVLEGVARDASASKPVGGVKVSAGSVVVQSDAQGTFRLEGIDPGIDIEALATGYGRLTMKYDGQASGDLVLKPNVLSITAVDRYTGKPLEGVAVTDGKNTVQTDAVGQAKLEYLPDGAEVTAKREGYGEFKLTFSGQDTVQAMLRPDTVIGSVKDAGGKPIAGASVSDGNSTVSTDAQGAFRIEGVPENAKLTISANGFQRQQLDVNQQGSIDVVLKPFFARGLYLTYYGVGDDGLRNHVLDMAAQSEINAVVIDVKGDRGWIAYKSSVPMVGQIGAQQEVTMKDPKGLLADLKKRGVYTIARIVAFKDNPLATARPDLAVMNSATGQPWVDNEGLRWADPTKEEVWDYDIALATEAIDLGFDEVQFDYVRFPTDASAGNSLSSITFSKPNTMAVRTAAINGFLEKARQAIKAKGGSISADIFGYVVWRDDDMGIGQHLEDLAQHVDYVSPMVYPDLFWDGIAVDGGAKYGNRQAGLYPYEIVNESMKVAVRRIGAAKLRPWLEYYNDYITGKTYTAEDIQVQKKATYENGVNGWLFWDPSNRFDKGGFDPKQ
ncbi:MAG TPA: putative glycoside hydrolase, partial [Chloroflexota bacterium]|nr:putative glycoside hydrolase [Chloroflexota bacterium]